MGRHSDWLHLSAKATFNTLLWTHLLCAKICSRDWRFRKNKESYSPWINSPPNGEDIEAIDNYTWVWQIFFWQDILMSQEKLWSLTNICRFEANSQALGEVREDFLKMETSELWTANIAIAKFSAWYHTAGISTINCYGAGDTNDNCYISWKQESLIWTFCLPLRPWPDSTSVCVTGVGFSGDLRPRWAHCSNFSSLAYL